jgi:hypothetical protein
MSDRLSSITGGASPFPGIMPPQVNEGAGEFKTSGGSSVSISPGEGNAGGVDIPKPEVGDISLLGRTSKQATAETFAESKNFSEAESSPSQQTPNTAESISLTRQEEELLAGTVPPTPPQVDAAAESAAICCGEFFDYTTNSLTGSKRRELTDQKRRSLNDSDDDEPPPDEVPPVDAAAAVPEVLSTTASPSGTKRTKIDISTCFDWVNKDQNKSQKVIKRCRRLISDAREDVGHYVGMSRVNRDWFDPKLTQDDIRKMMKEWSCECIAKAYIELGLLIVDDDVPVIYDSFLEEIKQILANGSDEQADHRAFTAGIYGNEDFFKQTAGPLRQLIADAIEGTLNSGELKLADDESVQAFFRKVMTFSAVARGVVAVAANPDSQDSSYFGYAFNSFDERVDKRGVKANQMKDPFGADFSLSQATFVRWLISDEYPNPDACLSLQPGKSSIPSVSESGCSLDGDGNVTHAAISMLIIGENLFAECIETAKYLKENPDNQEALAAFTLAMKKFIYAWSQSSTFYRGQAAILEMLVDGIAKYAGFQIKQPEIPEAAKTALRQLTHKFPDMDPRVEGSKTSMGYTVQVELFYTKGKPQNVKRKNDEKFLNDIYNHPDVFALLMPSFERFAELYQCTFVPIREAATPAATEPTASAQQGTETPAESVPPESVPV